MESRAVDVRGVSLFAESFGAPGDPAVLLVMGAMASGAWWPRRFCEALAARGRFVLRYDHRDTGRSTSGAPGGPAYTVEDLADDAVGVLQAHGLEAAHFVGMSLGGYLSQLAALRHPSRVLSLTLVASERLAAADPALPGISPELLAYHARAGELDWTDRAAVIDYQVGAWRLLHGSAHPFDEGLVRELAADDFDRTPNPLTAFNHARLGEAAPQWLGRLGEIRVPVLIVHGSEDPVLPWPHALAAHAAFPGSTLLPLPGTGHELHPADWPRIVEAIARHTDLRPPGR
jgi:pimeloyl-ACP methyl ester carboxylesterase